ncbi:secreted glucose methanol choline like oxidoreductase [Cryptosporidium ubiquitum]|uniref:Secreted glucose methanol choline like oxidoreductase n=1 Tax=Cryptosporidium ubiquitum TaxID=857276 RepID=A0A1J4MHI5_9CRYT|nr:secreted glucose methanol choline like oxidoreductase [Cryptosporidium ubiquitum]OII73694.1 secreted glucose methanol choline like oxidoreductase [Cryptosporidium ubiquitum]
MNTKHFILSICISIIILSINSVRCKLYYEDSFLVTDEKYDVIIIGAGVSGCSMANVYAKNGKKVLLLERGGPREKHPKTLVTKGAPGVITDESISEAITTSNGTLMNVANIVGGGASINGGFYVEPSAQFMRKTIESSGAKFDEEKYLNAKEIIRSSGILNTDNRLESNTFPQAMFEAMRNIREYSGNVSETPIYDPEGNNTFVTVSLFNETNRSSADILLSHENIQIYPYAVVESIQFSSTDESRDPYSLKKKVTAQCILGKMRSESDGFISVSSGMTQRTIYNNNGPKFKICLNKPDAFIVLTSGAIYSPAILMRSGIGPIEVLRRHGILPVKVLEQVGKNYHDHLQFGLFGILKEKQPMSIQKVYSYSNCSKYHPDPPNIYDELSLFHYKESEQENLNSTLSKNSFDLLLEPILTNPESPLFVPPEPTSPQYKEGNCYSTILNEVSGELWIPFAISQIVYRKSKVLMNPLLNYLALSLRTKVLNAMENNSTRISDDGFNKMLQPMNDCFENGSAALSFLTIPKSRGSITLDDMGLPEINSSDFSDPRDIEAAIVGMKHLIQLMTSQSVSPVLESELNSCIASIRSIWDSFPLFGGVDENNVIGFSSREQNVPALIPPLPKIINDKTAFDMVKESYSTIWHPTGTCSLGSVVDEDFNVRGTTNLKVGDASVFPEVSDVSPLGSVFLLATYIALVTS